jgi:hypothetical protein
MTLPTLARPLAVERLELAVFFEPELFFAVLFLEDEDDFLVANGIPSFEV